MDELNSILSFLLSGGLEVGPPLVLPLGDHSQLIPPLIRVVKRCVIALLSLRIELTLGFAYLMDLDPTCMQPNEINKVSQKLLFLT